MKTVLKTSLIYFLLLLLNVNHCLVGCECWCALFSLNEAKTEMTFNYFEWFLSVKVTIHISFFSKLSMLVILVPVYLQQMRNMKSSVPSATGWLFLYSLLSWWTVFCISEWRKTWKERSKPVLHWVSFLGSVWF